MKNLNLEKLVCTRIPTEEGSFQLCLYDNDADNNIFKATFGASFGTSSFGSGARLH